MEAKAEIIVSGRVQGVFFRVSGLAKANKLGLKYIAENKTDGTLHIYTEGHKENIEKLIIWCRNGPPLAKVTNVRVIWLNFE